MSEYEYHRIRESLSRPQLLFGAERNLVLYVLLVLFLSVYMALQSQFVSGIVIPLILTPIILRWLRIMGRKDPLLSKVFLKSRKYQQYFPAQSTPFAYLEEFSSKPEQKYRSVQKCIQIPRELLGARKEKC